jgi:hypothetical protein
VAALAELEPAMNQVRFPGLRFQVLDAIESLADRKYQERVWLRHEMPRPGYYDDLDLQVHTLFDDTAVLTEPESTVGEILHPSETVAMRRLGEVLGPLIKELGDAPDSAYLADPRWAEVVRLAAEALAVLRASEAVLPMDLSD